MRERRRARRLPEPWIAATTASTARTDNTARAPAGRATSATRPCHTRPMRMATMHRMRMIHTHGTIDMTILDIICIMLNMSCLWVGILYLLYNFLFTNISTMNSKISHKGLNN